MSSLPKEHCQNCGAEMLRRDAIQIVSEANTHMGRTIFRDSRHFCQRCFENWVDHLQAFAPGASPLTAMQRLAVLEEELAALRDRLDRAGMGG